MTNALGRTHTPTMLRSAGWRAAVAVHLRRISFLMEVLLVVTALDACASAPSSGTQGTSPGRTSAMATLEGSCRLAAHYGLGQQPAWVVPPSRIKVKQGSACHLTGVCIVSGPTPSLILAGKCPWAPGTPQYMLPEEVDRPLVRGDGSEIVVALGLPGPGEVLMTEKTELSSAMDFIRCVKLATIELPTSNAIRIGVLLRTFSVNPADWVLDSCRRDEEDKLYDWSGPRQGESITEFSIEVVRCELDKSTSFCRKEGGAK